MGLLKRIFAGPDQVAGIVDGATGLIDKFTFTNEERSEASFRAFELWLEYQKATSGQNVARRLIALIVVGLWAFLTVVVAVVGLVETLALEGEAAGAAFVFRLLSEAVSPLVIVVIGFYFSKGMLDQGLRVWRDKKSNRRGENPPE
jgi:hypothetical protein